jgi:hypothetical protein
MSNRPLLTRAELKTMAKSSYRDKVVPETSDIVDADKSNLDILTKDLTVNIN